MIDLFMSILIIGGTYLGSVGFSILLFRIFFPLKSKPVIENRVAFTYFKNNAIHASSKNRVVFMSDDGRRRAWVKVNS
jgi:hypothetical protein